ncbi:type II toxin-antitoxin system RelE/ParE family toxin [bacterium]|nr:type II toxin-antitoxin system RelE/ParE family toxin [bacterium]
MYEIHYEPEAVRALKKLPEDVRPRVAEAIAALASDPRPHGCLKMSGRKDQWRIRVGHYRVVYSIYDHMLQVWIIDADHRRDIY